MQHTNLEVESFFLLKLDFVKVSHSNMARRTVFLVTGTKPVLDVLFGTVLNNLKYFSAAMYSGRWGYEIYWSYHYIIKQ